MGPLAPEERRPRTRPQRALCTWPPSQLSVVELLGVPGLGFLLLIASHLQIKRSKERGSLQNNCVEAGRSPGSTWATSFPWLHEAGHPPLGSGAKPAHFLRRKPMGCSLSNTNMDPTWTRQCVCTNVCTSVISSSVRTGSISVASRVASCPFPAEPATAPPQAARVGVPTNTGELSLLELRVNRHSVNPLHLAGH